MVMKINIMRLTFLSPFLASTKPGELERKVDKQVFALLYLGWY